MRRGTPVVFEAAYGAGWVAELLFGLGLDPHLAHPSGCRAIAAAKLKYDKLDTRTLANLLRTGYLAEACLAPPEVREQRLLLRQRASLVRLRTMAKNRIRAQLADEGVMASPALWTQAGQEWLADLECSFMHAWVIGDCQVILPVLDERIALLEAEIRAQAKPDPRVEALKAIAGIGLLVAALDNGQLRDGPGLVLLDDADQIVSTTPEADRWLADLVEVAGGYTGGLPAAVYAVAAHARSAAAGSELVEPPRLRARTRSGSWLTLHGSCLAGRSAGLTAVIVEPSQPAEIAPVIVRAYGLSERERSVAQLVLRGRSTRQIATSLHLSPHTVQDHLKSIFARIGVRSRRELVAQVFADHYAPRLSQGDHPVASGYFD